MRTLFSLYQFKKGPRPGRTGARFLGLDQPQFQRPNRLLELGDGLGIEFDQGLGVGQRIGDIAMHVIRVLLEVLRPLVGRNERLLVIVQAIG